MSRLVARLSPLAFFLPLLARAAEAAKDAPAEKADPIVVIGFLFVLLASCGGYAAYLWKSKKGEKTPE